MSFWGGFSGSFANGFQLGRSIGAQRDINKLDDEEVTKEFKQTGLKKNPVQAQNQALSDQLLGGNAPIRGEFSGAAPENRGIPEALTANTGNYTPESYAKQLRAGDMREAMNAEIAQENFQEQARADLTRAMSAEQFAYDQANPPKGLVNPKARVLRASMTPLHGPGAIPYEERGLIPEPGPSNAAPVRGEMSRDAYFDPDGYSYLGKRFDAPLTEYDRQYAKQDAIADIYAKRGLFDLSEKARSRAMDFREKGQDRAFREDERAYSRGRDAKSDEQAALDRAERRKAADLDAAFRQYQIETDAAQQQFQNRLASDEAELRGRQVADAERNSAVNRAATQTDTQLSVQQANREYFEWFHDQEQDRKVREVNDMFRAVNYGDQRAMEALYDLAMPVFNGSDVKDNVNVAGRRADGTPVITDADGNEYDFYKYFNSLDPMQKRAYAGLMHQYALASVTGDYTQANDAWSKFEASIAARKATKVDTRHEEVYKTLNTRLERELALRQEHMGDEAKTAEIDSRIDKIRQQMDDITRFRMSDAPDQLAIPAPPIPVGAAFKGEDGKMYLKQPDGKGLPAVWDEKANAWTVEKPEPEAPPPETPTPPQEGLTKPNPGTGRPSRSGVRERAAAFRKQEDHEDQADAIIEQIRGAPSADEAARIFETNREFLEMVSQGTLATDYVRGAQYWLDRRGGLTR